MREQTNYDLMRQLDITANLRSEVSTLRAEQTRLREALEEARKLFDRIQRCDALAARAALASLLPTQEEPTQTDENRVSFAAGYSQALDDQAKGLK